MASAPLRLDDSTPLDRDTLERLRDEEFKPHRDLRGLKQLRDKASTERHLRELYRDRAPYELLQNADDAGATRACFVLTEEGLAFAHDGEWFTVANFRSLADGWSDKDPKECIGHKGIGFRSVLDITPAPHVLRVGKVFFGAKFTWALNNGHIQATLQARPDLRDDYEKWTKHGQSACPVMAIPGLAKKDSLGAGARVLDRLADPRDGVRWTTMLWFPAVDKDANAHAIRELDVCALVGGDGRETLEQFLKDEVSVLLPFLSSIERVELCEGDRILASVRLEGNRSIEGGGEIKVILDWTGAPRRSSFFDMEFRVPIPRAIKDDPGTPRAARHMDEAKIRLSVRLQNGWPVFDEKASFHVYLPTEERTGVGFIIHGDFFVKPDRTRLMVGKYNEWLLGVAADRAANAFLTELLRRYRPEAVPAALSPVDPPASTAAAAAFLRLFSDALKGRGEAFIPIRSRLARRGEVVVPAVVDTKGFWLDHFGDVIEEVIPGKKCFLDPVADSTRARRFLGLAGVVPVGHERLLDFIEATGKRPRTPGWWLECYTYIFANDHLPPWKPDAFTGRALIPVTDSSVIAVPSDRSVVVCLPPAGPAADLRVPECFSRSFEFVNAELARLLLEGSATVRSAVLERFGIVRFEATELLPRAVRGTVNQFFDGAIALSLKTLCELWFFIQRIVASSRATISSGDFWDDIGRLPVPVHLPEEVSKPIPPGDLVPAFLAYWPDSMLDSNSSLHDVPSLRRVTGDFLDALLDRYGGSRKGWEALFDSAGLSNRPRLRKYGRVPGTGSDLSVGRGGAALPGPARFTGDRQLDENLAAIESLRTDGLWEAWLSRAPSCAHPVSRVLNSVTVVEGLGPCVRAAMNEHADGATGWKHRLWSLVMHLALAIPDTPSSDQLFCRGGGAGHFVPMSSYVQMQLNHYAWLPSSHGPQGRRLAFFRVASRHLISSGVSQEDLGDRLLPYVVVDDSYDTRQLERLGVERLDDAQTAKPTALVRALTMLGARLSEEHVYQDVVKVRGRWRFVRGALQEVYRELNQEAKAAVVPPGIKLAARWGDDIKFVTAPLYYAEPGSSVEEAFSGVLPLFAADRTYPKLFDRMRIKRLTLGETVEEKFDGEHRSAPTPDLQREIIEELGPLLLSVVVAMSERDVDKDRVLRRLRGRFEVRVIDRIEVRFVLKDEPPIERTIESRRFYLRRRLVEGPGAVSEWHYTLYIASKASACVADLDGDALGAALAPIFSYGSGEDVVGTYPRIVVRYQKTPGDRDQLKEFLYSHLGISKEAQEIAFEMMTSAGRAEEPPALNLPPPPPAKVISSPLAVAQGASLKDVLQIHQDALDKKAAELIDDLTPGAPAQRVPRRPQTGLGTKLDRVTQEQQDRGKRGEAEMLRRLRVPGGWEGFTLVEDRTDAGCGYDFLCALAGREVKMEVKTFAVDGRVIMTSGELREAAASKDDYYLVGLLDDGPEHQWSSVRLQNPIHHLLSLGEFEVEAKLRVGAAELFSLGGASASGAARAAPSAREEDHASSSP